MRTARITNATAPPRTLRSRLLGLLWAVALVSADRGAQKRYRNRNLPLLERQLLSGQHPVGALRGVGSRGSLTTKSEPTGSNTQQQTVPTLSKSTTASTTTTAGAPIPSHVFNLIKSIVGAGVLGLPAGIAAYGIGDQTAIIPALILIACIGSMAAYGFTVIGRLCAVTNARSYRDVWKCTVSPTTSWIPSLACLLVTTCSVLSYSMILSQTIPALVQFVLPQAVLSRVQGLLAITLIVLLPLCLLPNLAALAPFSLVGIFGMIYTCAAMVVRYLQRVYTVEQGSDMLASLPLHLRPSFSAIAAGSQQWLSTNAFVLISMLATAYMAHYNAPKFYWELRQPSVARFHTVVVASFIGAMTLMAIVATMGYLTFGQAAQGLILNNYSATRDTLMTASRFAVTTSLICSYPLAFGGVRDGVWELLHVQRSDNANGGVHRRHTISSVLLLAAITVLALIVTDLRLVMALGGATWGNCLIYIFPAVMMVQYNHKTNAAAKANKINTKKQQQHKDDMTAIINSDKEWPLAVANGVLGLIIGVIGTVRAIKSI